MSKQGEYFLEEPVSTKHNSTSPYSHPWLAQTLFAFDAPLRRHHGVIEYSAHPACLFRIEIAHSHHCLTLTDGTVLRPGERVARLHFWNEHIPPVPNSGTTIRWARQMQRSISISLHELTRYLLSRSDLCDISVICGDVPSATRRQCQQIEYIMAYYGFEAVMVTGRPAFGERMHRLGENILISLVVFAQNPATLRVDTLMRVRVPIYMSRRTLDRKFGSRDSVAILHV
jgi:hypothetical protein